MNLILRKTFQFEKISKKFYKRFNREKFKKKNSVCTGTRGRSKISLNSDVHENVKVYMNQYVKFFLKFP